MVNSTETRSLLVKMLEEYDMKDPLAALPDLLKMYALVPSEDRTPQWTDKQNRLSDIIAASVGLWLEPVVIAKETDRIQISAECLSAAGVISHCYRYGSLFSGRWKRPVSYVASPRESSSDQFRKTTTTGEYFCERHLLDSSYSRSQCYPLLAAKTLWYNLPGSRCKMAESA